MYLLNRSIALKSSALGLIFLFCVSFIACLQKNSVRQIQAIATSMEEREKKDFTIQRRLSIIKNTPSLGFRNIIADSLFLSFLQYFSNATDESDTPDAGEHLSPMFFESIISLDPFYRNYYLFLSSSTTLYAAQPQKTVEIMDKGLKRIDPEVISDSFYIWRYKGVDELLFVGDSQAARKSFQKAADWASRSSDPSSELMRKVSQQTADFLETNPDSSQAQVAAWSSVLFNALDDTTRKKAAERIEGFGGSVDFLEDGNVRIKSTASDSSDESGLGS